MREGPSLGATSGRRRRILFLLVLALLLGLWLRNLDLPFSRVFGYADYISNENGRIAANHLRYGLRRTLGDQIRNLEPAPPEDWVHYNNHPAGLDLLTALVFRATGSRDPWAHRLLPLLASLGSLLLLCLLCRQEGREAWIPLTLLSGFPLFAAHGLNLSYEPLGLALMLGIVLGYERGRRAGLLPLVWLGGLIDYPVLYLVPFLAAVEVCRMRRKEGSLGFAALLCLTALLSFGTHLLHLGLTMGGLEATDGRPWYEHVLRSLEARAEAPGLGAFFERQFHFFVESFGLVGLALALAGLLTPGPGGLALPAFLFAGGLHLFLFRSHAMVHDFWLWYLLPAFALSAGGLLARLPRGLALALLSLTLVLGLRGGLEVWKERAEPRVREVAEDLSRLFPGETVLHVLLGPSGWALETFRGHPVLDGGDLLHHPFSSYLDRLGSSGFLERPQRLLVPEKALAGGWRKALEEKVLPGAFLERKFGREGPYLVYDPGPIFLDPERSPFFVEPSVLDPGRTDGLNRDGIDFLRNRARKFLILPAFPPGSRILFLDGSSSRWERFRGRYVRSGRIEEAGTGLPAAAWPGTEAARNLRKRFGSRVEVRRVKVLGREEGILVLP